MFSQRVSVYKPMNYKNIFVAKPDKIHQRTKNLKPDLNFPLNLTFQ